MQLAPEEVQFDCTLRVLVRDLEQLVANDRLASELFAHFAEETAFVRLTLFALAAGKFPEPLEVCAAQPPRDQIRATPLDDRGGDHDSPISHVRCQG